MFCKLNPCVRSLNLNLSVTWHYVTHLQCLQWDNTIITASFQIPPTSMKVSLTAPEVCVFNLRHDRWSTAGIQRWIPQSNPLRSARLNTAHPVVASICSIGWVYIKCLRSLIKIELGSFKSLFNIK